MPLLTYPLALFGLVAVPALIGIYMFRSRFRRQPVSSHLLWEALARAKEGGTFLRRLQVPLLFFLELLALLLLVAAALDPRWQLARRQRSLVVVLDDSASMQAAGADGGSARARAARAVAREVRRGRFQSVQFILAGDQATVLGSVLSESRVPAAVLAPWRCRAPRAALGAAVSAALELGGPRARVLVVTDGKPDTLPDTGRLRWLAFGTPAANVGFVNAARTRGPTADRCFFEVANYSGRAARTTLVLQRDDESGTTDRRPLSLDAGERRKITFDVPAGAGGIRAALADDALTADNEVRLLPLPVRRVRVALDVRDAATRRVIERAVDATGLRASAQAAPQLVFTDAAAGAPTRRAETWTVRVRNAGPAQSFVGPFIVDNSHPLCDGLDLDGLIWSGSATNALPGLPVILAGNVPLVTDHRRLTGGRDIYVQFQPTRSTVQDSPNWPVLLWNLMRWRGWLLPGPSDVNLRVGMHAVLGVARSEKEATVVCPDGSTKPVPVSDGRALVALPEPGLYTVQAGGRTDTFCANFLAPDESDLRGRATGTWGRWTDVETLQRDYLSSAWIFVVAALGVLTVHMTVAARAGRGV